MKTPRVASESSTTSDNTTEFIDIVKKYDVVYNTHNPDYKNVEVKMKVWSQIADEIGLSVDASKRKWKNLRDSYTKYLRSFRIGTKTSKKYQYWAHAEHMDFLKPYQGPGRNSTNNKNNDDEDTECDLGYQVVTKATTSSSEDDVKVATLSNAAQNLTAPPPSIVGIPQMQYNVQHSSTITAASAAAAASSTITTSTISPFTSISPSSNGPSAIVTTSTAAIPSTTNLAHPSLPPSSGAFVLPIPSLPTVQLPPQLGGKSILGSLSSNHSAITGTLPTSMPTQVFPIPPQLSNNLKPNSIPMPVSSTASSVGCLILEPHMFATTTDTFKKELSAPNTVLSLFNNINPQATSTTTSASNRGNPPLITKIRRVQPSPQTTAINLSFSASAASHSTPSPAVPSSQPPPPKARKVSDRNDIDIAAILHANRELDANTLFFLSLSRSVRAMPTKFQSLAKMRCMRIISDIELELDNVGDCQGPPTDDASGANGCNTKYFIDSPPPPPPPHSMDGATIMHSAPVNDAATEHFVYVMSPSRVESMIDISSDEENTMNGN